MSFTFDFPNPDSDAEPDVEEAKNQSHNTNTNSKRLITSVDVLTSKEIVEFYNSEIVDKLSKTSMEFNDCRLKLIDTSCLEDTILNDDQLKNTVISSSILNAVTSHSDLVSGSYEGGLKIWECGVDLTDFLSSHPIGSAIEIKEKQVLEVGCGVGLPGLYSLKKGASCVHFQDYNEEVLKVLTHTNISLNFEDKPACRYFSGDWDSFTDLASKKKLKYDVILTAETIYNEQSYIKLHRLFDSLLERDGKVILAAKTYYFGVGGNVNAFCEFVTGLDVFTIEEVHSIQTGVPRKILLLERKAAGS